MRIAHVCLAAFYIEGYGYQENILPRIHKKMGHEVEVIASTETYVEGGKLGYVEPCDYVNEDGIRVLRLAYSSWMPRFLQSKLRSYRGLPESLERFNPDLIFLHDIQFWDILRIKRYAKENCVVVVADGHTDFVNSAKTFFSRWVLHGIFYRRIIRSADPIIQRYYPTLPCRAKFMQDVYGLSPCKMELLPFGYDDSVEVEWSQGEYRKQLRNPLGILETDTVIATGGKLDLRKNIHVLLEAFIELRQSGQCQDTHIIVFGEPSDEVGDIFDKLFESDNVHWVGWVAAKEIHRVLKAADVAFFPGTHSVIWEEVIGLGLGAVFRYWEGMEHLDLGGNLMFVPDGKKETLRRFLVKLHQDNNQKIKEMNSVALELGSRSFLFSRIASVPISLVQKKEFSVDSQ